jgi:hypothetical protein
MLTLEAIANNLESITTKAKIAKKIVPVNLLIDTLTLWFDQDSGHLPTKGSVSRFGNSGIKQDQLYYFANTLEHRLKNKKIKKGFINQSKILSDQVKAIRLHKEKEQQKQR